jgi:DNA-binding MltR family transcriptional regulator
MTKYKTPQVENLSEESRHLYDVINDESDIACVLIGTSYLDQTLASLLERNFIESQIGAKLLNPNGGALGTFNGRADLAYCLGLISKSFYANLCKVAEIRNKFAHRHLLLTLADTEIVTSMDALTFPTVAESIAIDEDGKRQDNPEPFSHIKHPRDRFNVIVGMMVNSLLLSGLATKRKEGKSEGWS